MKSQYYHLHPFADSTIENRLSAAIVECRSTFFAGTRGIPFYLKDEKGWHKCTEEQRRWDLSINLKHYMHKKIEEKEIVAILLQETST